MISSIEQQTMDIVYKDNQNDINYTNQCQFCSFSSSNRLLLAEHISSHSTSRNDNFYDYSKPLFNFDNCNNDEQQLLSPTGKSNDTSPLSNHHDDSDDLDDIDGNNLNIPRNNVNGKMKVNKCKYCGFTSITKTEYWQHKRQHMKAEKILTCTKCEFITEYKHHLEYHLRTHFGSKPFKCTECEYTCFNKSMLNSHLKSHSPVSPYQCADCPFQTKHCHALKLHLRKLQHAPGKILNPDGSVNKTMVIDVHGTRRGPKSKSTNNNNINNNNNNNNKNNNINNNNDNKLLSLTDDETLTSDTDSTINKSNSSLTNENLINIPQISPINNCLTGLNASIPSMFNTYMNSNQFLHYNQFMNHPTFPLSNSTGFNDNQNHHTNNPESKLQISTQPYLDYMKCSNTYLNNDNTTPATPPLNEDVQQLSPQLSKTSINNSEIQINDKKLDGKVTPLDLSKSDSPTTTNPTNNNINNVNNVNIDVDKAIHNYQEHLSPPQLHQQQQQHNHQQSNPVTSTVSSPKAPGTNRRKGRAVKLERKVVEFKNGDELKSVGKSLSPTPLEYSPSQLTFKNNINVNSTSEESSPTNSNKINNTTDNSNSNSNKNGFKCSYCDITFGNEIMYTVHMGYHGYNNPFTCNMCGQQLSNAMEFFIHMAKVQHF